MALSDALSAQPAQRSPGPRLDYLDGIRGLAALYVVLFHAMLEVTWRDGGRSLPHMVRWMVPVTGHGYLAVVVFIVLSGYCLMLPIARSTDGQLPAGLANYLRRRARRILPPYYVALALSLVILAFTPLGQPSGNRFDYALPAFSPATLLSHLALVHNWDGDWVRRINPPHWSVALEWQIYFLFPLLLLPLWRRFGIVAAFAVGAGVGMLPEFLGFKELEMSSPWLVGVFALGMAAAFINHSDREGERHMLRRLPWYWLSPLLWLMVVAVCVYKPKLTGGYWKTDFLVGLATMALLVSLADSTSSVRARWPAVVARALSDRRLVALGAFSYSLYLIHSPLLGLATIEMDRYGLEPAGRIAVLGLAVIPLLCVAAYGFHILFERPFLPGVDRGLLGGRGAPPCSVQPTAN